MTTFSNSYTLADGSTLTLTATVTPPVSQPPTPDPTDVNTVTVGSATHVLTGTNVDRTAEGLVRYTAPVTVTATNEWGCEVTIVGGKVTASNDRQPSRSLTGTPVPADGCVLSGHGASRDWLLAHATVGASVTFSKSAQPPTPDPPPVVLPPTPGTAGGKTVALYHMMWSGNPRLSTVPAQVNEVRLAFAQGSPPSLVGWGGQTQESFVADAAALRARGARILVSMGGQGGNVNIGNHAAFLSGVDNSHNQLGGNLDGIDWDLEAVGINATDCLAIVAALKAKYGASFWNSFAPNGGNVDRYLPVAVACQKAGMLDSYGQQFYDATVSVSDALSRIHQAIDAGIPASKITVGMMIASDAKHWTNAQCVANYKQLKAAVPQLGGAYLWEHSRGGTNQWAQEVGALV